MWRMEKMSFEWEFTESATDENLCMSKKSLRVTEDENKE